METVFRNESEMREAQLASKYHCLSVWVDAITTLHSLHPVTVLNLTVPMAIHLSRAAIPRAERFQQTEFTFQKAHNEIQAALLSLQAERRLSSWSSCLFEGQLTLAVRTVKGLTIHVSTPLDISNAMIDAAWKTYESFDQKPEWLHFLFV